MSKCKYDGTGVWAGRCTGTKEVDPCVGHDKCPNYKPNVHTNEDFMRDMAREMLAKHLVAIGWDCHNCSEHERLDNEPLLRGEKCDEQCVKHCLEWLQKPMKEK